MKPTTSRDDFLFQAATRRGIMLPTLAVMMVAMVGFLALAIDVGMMAVAKTQAQNAADLSSLAAARTLNGDSTNGWNESGATTNAKNLLTYNAILGHPIVASQLTLTYGSYDYSQSAQTFSASYPGTVGQPETAVTAKVVSNSNLTSGFSKIFGSSFLPNVTAVAQAAHRPRDLGLVMDLSSSMRYGTMLGFDITTSSRDSNNPDTNVPTFGAYSSTADGLVGGTANQTSSYQGYTISPSNTTAPNSSYSLTYINGFYSNAAYATTLIRAFDSYTSTDLGATWSAPSSGATPQLAPSSYGTTPGGDVPLFKLGSSTVYAQTVKDLMVSGSTARNASWELDGYSGYSSGSPSTTVSTKANYTTTPFYGYTQGPGYYGKTFFTWPPDPRRPLNTVTATSWSTTANDLSTLQQFLTDFGYATADTANTAFTTTLGSAMTTTTGTSLTVASASKFPASGPFRVLIQSEILLVTAGAGTTNWTVTRKMDSTTAATHISGSTVALVTGPPIAGLYTAATTSANGGKTPSTSQTWPWPNDGGTALSTYLTSNVYIPVSVSTTARLLQTTDAAYQKIMRLYNWNYAADDVGTTPCDWRLRFLNGANVDDNSKVFDSTGELNLPGANTYTIDYGEILRWITQTPNPFPTQLRAGRIKYYGSIPTAITGTWPKYGNTDQRFWVEFIDHVLGFRQTSAGVYTDVSAMVGYGSDYTWGTIARTAPPSATQYMSYSDNPQRPNLRYWFSPILMVDYLHNYNLYQNTSNYFVMQPGDSYEAPLYTGRQAFQAAINTIQDNHPNDWFTLAFYSEPRASSSDTDRFNCVAAPMGTNYSYALSSLFFPFSTINADGTPNNTEVTPYDADASTGAIPSNNFIDTPRPKGNTCFSMGLMLCFNQFAVTPSSDTTLRSFVTSTPITFPTAMAGGMGRKGAQKVIIFETDGLPNATATASLVSVGTGGNAYKYYKIRYDMNKPSGSEYPTTAQYNINDSTVTTQIYSLVDQLASTYGTSRNPFRLYAIGFGPVFSGSDATGAKTTLQNMQYHAGTQPSASTALPANQIITGTDSTMSANMISTFTSILQNGVQIALIK